MWKNCRDHQSSWFLCINRQRILVFPMKFSCLQSKIIDVRKWALLICCSAFETERLFFLFDLREVNWCPDHVTKNSKSSSYVTYHIQIFREKCTQSVQNFLIKLQPCMHLVEISIFSSKLCHHLTYQNYDQPPQTSQNPYFQSYFCVFRMVKSFRKKNIWKIFH